MIAFEVANSIGTTVDNITKLWSVANTPHNGIFYYIPIIHILLQWHMIAFVVLWMQFQGQSNNFVNACIVSSLVLYNGTTLETITKL